MIDPSEIAGVDETTARRILVYARTVASGVENLDGLARMDAIAILDGVAREARVMQSRVVASQRVGPAQVSYRDVASWFTDEDRSALRMLVGAQVSGGPVGVFPAGRPFKRVWPEEE